MGYKSIVLFIRIFLYDALFYISSAFLFFLYFITVEKVIHFRLLSVFVSLSFGLALLLLWLWNTQSLLLALGNKNPIALGLRVPSALWKRKMIMHKWLFSAAGLWLFMVLVAISLVFLAHTAVQFVLGYFVKTAMPLLITSLVLALLMLCIFMPLFVFALFIFYGEIIKSFFCEKRIAFQKFVTCLLVFDGMTILALGLKFLPEEAEVIFSGIILMVYFAWQKAYLLEK